MVEGRRRIVGATLLLAWGLVACKGAPLALYEGPPRALDRIAVLDSMDPSRARVVAIDDEKIRGATFHLEPGRHEIWVNVNVTLGEDLAIWQLRLWCGIAVDFEAGKVYDVVLVNEKTKGTTRGSEVRVAAKIVRSDTGEEFHPASCGGKPDFER